jgi:excisionase family DNA binding protein
MPYYTLKEVADELRVSESTVRRWLLSGEMRGLRLGDRAGWRISDDDLKDFINRRRGEDK